MPSHRIPGSTGQIPGLVGIDLGTVCLAESPLPTTVGTGGLLLQGRVVKEPYTSERVRCVIEAYLMAGELAPIEFNALVPSRADALEMLQEGTIQIVKTLGAAALLGAAGGFVVGAVFGAATGAVVGAIVGGPPGAVAGAAVGAVTGAEILTAAGWNFGLRAGMAVLAGMGLAAVAQMIADDLGEVVVKVMTATKRAWEAAEYPDPRRQQEIFRAGRDLARAIALLLKDVLVATVTVLLGRGASSVKQQAKALSVELGESRFGAKLAGYIEKNAEKLVEDAQLKPRAEVLVRNKRSETTQDRYASSTNSESLTTHEKPSGTNLTKTTHKTEDHFSSDTPNQEQFQKDLPPLRQQYESEVLQLKELGSAARLAGADTETTARFLYDERNALKIKYRELSPVDKVRQFEVRNIEKYGNSLGPSIEQLRASGKSWEDIIESASRPGGNDIIF